LSDSETHQGPRLVERLSMDFASLNPPYALDIVANENKPGPNSLITGKITGNFLKFSLR
jgi:hypothetical protein